MSDVTRFRDFFKIFIILTFALALGACELMGPRKQDEPVVMEPEEEEEVMPLPTDSLTPNKRVREALALLQNGDYENARNQLNWALMDHPDHSRATHLLEQMDADPIEYLGLKNFFYDVQPGDSLSLIAKNFLNDPYKFVILARYNKLENPGRLAPGQRIRVPGESREIVKPKVKARPKPKPEPVIQSAETESEAIETTADSMTEIVQEPIALPTEPNVKTESEVTPDLPASNSEEILNTARKLHSGNDLPSAIYLLEDEGNRQPESKEIRTLLASYYTEYSEQLITINDLEGARSTLEKLIILDASDENAINQLILVEDKIEAQNLFQKASNAESGGQYEEAYKTYGQVLTYDPDNLAARESQLKVRNIITDNYHRQAMQLFRKQELDEAIAFWNKILELDPNHSLAPGYKARALEMKQQLQRIGTGAN